jgi:hypothetical protein
MSARTFTSRLLLPRAAGLILGAATADLYTKIKDTSLRTEVLTRHAREWLTKDPAAARAWLESSSALPPRTSRRPPRPRHTLTRHVST